MEVSFNGENAGSGQGLDGQQVAWVSGGGHLQIHSLRNPHNVRTQARELWVGFQPLHTNRSLKPAQGQETNERQAWNQATSALQTPLG